MHDIDRQLSHMLKGEFDQAWEISQKLQSIGPDDILDPEGNKNPEMWIRHEFNRGWFFLRQGDLQTGSKLLESGRHISVYGGTVLSTKAPIYNPDEHDIKNKTIIISLEGGYGDEIIHVRFAQSYKNLGAKKVIVACAPELKTLIKRVPGVDIVIQRDEANTIPHDYWVPGFSAGWLAGHSYEDLPNDPYLSSNEMSHQIWSGIITSPKPKIGIRWAGNPKFEHQQFRKFPPQFLFDLAKYEDVQLYSLQRDNNLEELPSTIIDLQQWLVGWEDTVAAITHMDLIITSCTSIAHISAALGKPTWVLPPILPYHTWAPNAPHSNTSPWYKSVTLYRQADYEKWNRTFQRLYRDFESHFGLPVVEHDNFDLEVKRLNMGSGVKKLPNYVNADKFAHFNPDEIVDFEQLPWPWKDNEFSHIVAKDILEYLGPTPQKFAAIIKEMYRVSRNGAVWEIETAHHRSDKLTNDPLAIRAITPILLEAFNQKCAMHGVMNQLPHCPLAFELDVDFEICDTKYEFTPLIKQKRQQGKLDQEELDFAFHTMNNIADNVRMLIEVHKPGRYTIKEFEDAIRNKQDELGRNT